MENKKAICFWCHNRCRLEVAVRDGHLVDAREDPDFPIRIWPSRVNYRRIFRIPLKKFLIYFYSKSIENMFKITSRFITFRLKSNIPDKIS